MSTWARDDPALFTLLARLNTLPIREGDVGKQESLTISVAQQGRVRYASEVYPLTV